MVQETRDMIGERAQAVAQLIRQNPLPAALVGVGLGWLFMCARDGASQGHSRDMQAPGASHSVGDKASHISQTLQRSVGEVGHRAERLAEQAQTSIRETLGTAKQTLGTYAKTVQERGRNVEGWLSETFHDNPWLVGAAVLAAGTAVGLAVPISRREDQWMGKVRDGLLREAGVRAQDAIQKVEDAARRSADNTQRPNGGQSSAAGSAM